MSRLNKLGVVINVVSFDPRKHPHVASILEDSLWGFSDITRHRNSWGLLDQNTRVLIYGDKAIRMAAYVQMKCESHEPIRFWVRNPVGYPLHLHLELLNRDVENIQPISNQELNIKHGIPLAKKGFRGMALILFGNTSQKSVIYPIRKFETIWDDFTKRNNLLPQV